MSNLRWLVKFQAALAIFGCQAALASSFSTGSTGYTPPAPGNPSVNINPSVPSIPVIPVMPVMPGGRTVPLVPTDYTNIPVPSLNYQSTLPAGEGVKSTSQFPSDLPDQDLDGILVRSLNGADFTRPSLASVTLNEGSILVSVRKPSRLGLINTSHGVVSVAGDADVIVTCDKNDGLVRVLNLTGLGENVKMKVHHQMVQARIHSTDAPVVVPTAPQPPALALSLKVGHELVVADRPLVKADLHPADGIGRRRFNFLESHFLAVNEFSLASLLTGSDLLVDLRQKVDGLKERRIVGDLSKMAAVLNYLNGEQGYTVAKPN